MITEPGCIVVPLENACCSAVYSSATATITRESESSGYDHGTKLYRRAAGKYMLFCRVELCLRYNNAIESESRGYEHGTELYRRAAGNNTLSCRVQQCQRYNHAPESESGGYDHGTKLYRRAAGKCMLFCRV